MTRIIEQRLLTDIEAGNFLGIKRTKIYELCKRGDLKPVYIDTSKRFCIYELEKFADRLIAERDKKL